MLLLYIFGLAMSITVTAKSTSRSQSEARGSLPFNSLYSDSSTSRVITKKRGHVKLAIEPEPPRYEWQYDNEKQWPGHLCHDGKRQSPIDINTELVVPDAEKQFIKYGDLILHGYQSVLVSGVNNGRTVQFTMEGDEAMHPTLTGGPLRYLYRLEQLHFHWISEHAVDGYKYPMEVHFVHTRADLSTTEALRKRDGIAILAVFGNIKSEIENDEFFIVSEMMEEVVRQLPQLSEYGDRVSGIVLNMSKLLTPSQQSYVTYAGSLTSPECNEVVTWIILDNPVFMTYGQYKEFWDIAKTRYNFRNLQDANTTVYRPSVRFQKPVIFSVFGNMFSAVANFFKNMNKMLSSPGLSKKRH